MPTVASTRSWADRIQGQIAESLNPGKSEKRAEGRPNGFHRTRGKPVSQGREELHHVARIETREVNGVVPEQCADEQANETSVSSQRSAAESARTSTMMRVFLNEGVESPPSVSLHQILLSGQWPK
jgi:hypothetical protein